MRTRAILACVVVCGLGWAEQSALGQAPPDEHVAHGQDNNDGGANDGARPTAPAVGVSNLGVVMAGTRFMAIFQKSYAINQLDFRLVDDFNFRFRSANLDTEIDTKLYDPRAEHDPIHNRLWAAYLEGKVDEPFLIDHCHEGPTWLHLAVNVAGADFTLGGGLDQFYYYTLFPGATIPPRHAYDLTDGGYRSYKNLPTGHEPMVLTARMASLGFLTPSGEAGDRDGAMVVAVNSIDEPLVSCVVPPEGTNGPPPIDGMSQFIYVFPFQSAGGAESILDGNRMPESEITVIRPLPTICRSRKTARSTAGWCRHPTSSPRTRR